MYTLRETGKLLPIKTGFKGVDCDSRLREYITTDDNSHIKMLSSSQYENFVLDYFSGAIRTYHKLKKNKKNQKITKTYSDIFADNSIRHDVTWILICLHKNRVMIKDCDAFFKISFLMFLTVDFKS